MKNKQFQGFVRLTLAALLLAIALTGCGGDKTDAEGQIGKSPEAGTEGTAEPVYHDGQQSGDLAEDSRKENEAAESDKENKDNPNESSSNESKSGENEHGNGGDENKSDESNSSTPSPIFVDKLTEEGKGWGLSFRKAGEQPVGNASREELAQYDAYFMGDDSEKVIYLTFDCGYENGNTALILDTLKEHDVQATFFVVGHFLEKAPELVKRMADEGHAVGNHTWHHYDIDTLDKEAFQAELEDIENLFREITGKELSKYYRPPQGKCGINNLKMAQELGYSAIFWSLAYVDWDVNNQPTHQAALDTLTSRAHPGAIVLLHIISKTNGEILDELLTKWEEMGYSFKPLSELT